MAYIEKGDLLRVNGKIALADSNDYTKLLFNTSDEYCENDVIAAPYVNVVFPDTGTRGAYPLKVIEKL